MADSQYTFDSRPNSYYRGSDLRVTDGTDFTIIVNEKERNLLGVDVKDEETVHQLPADIRAAFDKLGEPAAQMLYERVQAEFWDWADDCAKRHGFDGVYQEGRSGGWACIDTDGLFDTADLIEPQTGEEGTADAVGRFLAFAFEVARAVEEDWREDYHRRLKDAADALDGAEHVAAVARADDQRSNPLFTLTFSEDDVRSMARDMEVHPERAIKLAHEHAKTISERLTEQGNELLHEFTINPIATEAAERTREGEEPYWTRFCPDCHIMVEPDGEEELTCSNGHTFKRSEAFAVVWGEEIPFDQPAMWTELEVVGFTADPHTEELPDGTERLDRLSIGDRFEDAVGDRFWKAGDGPTQGAVIITDGEHYQSWDCGLMVRPLNKEAAA